MQLIAGGKTGYRPLREPVAASAVEVAPMFVHPTPPVSFPCRIRPISLEPCKQVTWRSSALGLCTPGTSGVRGSDALALALFGPHGRACSTFPALRWEPISLVDPDARPVVALNPLATWPPARAWRVPRGLLVGFPTWLVQQRQSSDVRLLRVPVPIRFHDCL